MRKSDRQTPIIGPVPSILPGSIESGRDPYEALDALMLVVEALCPEWPPRNTFAASSRFIL
jgi:hypothetical protein